MDFKNLLFSYTNASRNAAMYLKQDILRVDLTADRFEDLMLNALKNNPEALYGYYDLNHITAKVEKTKIGWRYKITVWDETMSETFVGQTEDSPIEAHYSLMSRVFTELEKKSQNSLLIYLKHN